MASFIVIVSVVTNGWASFTSSELIFKTRIKFQIQLIYVRSGRMPTTELVRWD